MTSSAPHFSYRLCRGIFYAVFLLVLAAPTWSAESQMGIVKEVQFARDRNTIIISGSVKGYRYIDYQVHAGAGQRLSVQLRGSHRANYFNLLPPGSTNAAMASGELSENRFEGLLPDDGVYTVRVYLIRAAARRNESSNFKLSIAVEGRALERIPSKIDAVLPGTRFHASASVACEPAYSSTRQCEAFVIRRGYDGTATVELRWQTESKIVAKRRILFIKGEAVAADVSLPMVSLRDEFGWKVKFDDNEHFSVPMPLVFGG